jgi:TM2 domain-containing membrane protein YozV
LYWSGKGTFYPAYAWIIVPLCFVVIGSVPLFYFPLARVLAKELRGNSK